MLIQSEADGVHELIFNCINACPIDTRKNLYNAIVLSGANTMFPGFSSRLESEVRNLYKERVLGNNSGREIKINFNIIDTPRRKFSVFMGACFLSNFYANQESYWISRQEWEEIGPEIVHKKCQNMMI
jgi:actin-related protein 2